MMRSPLELLVKTPRRWWWPALALTGVFLLKLTVVFELRDHPLLQPDAGLDTTAYVSLAERVLSGDVALGPGLYYVSPLYIYFLALVYGVTHSFDAVRVVQVTLGTATVACVFVMANVWAGRRAAWLAAGLATACGLLTFHEVLLMQSSLDGFLTAAALTSLTLGLAGGPRRAGVGPSAGTWFFITGVLFGLETLNRPNVLGPTVVAAGALVAAGRARASALVAAGVAIALLPVAARNVVVAGEWSLVSSHGGLNFYIGNHERATGFYQVVPGVRPEIVGQADDTRLIAERAAGRPLSDTEVSDYFARSAWTWIRTHPGQAARLFAEKLSLVFHADYSALPHSFLFYADDARTTLRWLCVSPWFLVPLGLTGLVMAAPHERRTDYLVWASFVPAYAVALSFFFVAERYRLPLLVPFAAAAGALSDRLVVGLGARSGGAKPGGRWWVLTMAVAAGTFALSNRPLALPDSREGDRLRMIQHEARMGRFDQVEHWAALAGKSSTAPARVSEVAGRALLSAGQPALALPHLQRARALGVRSPDTLADLAQAAIARGDPGAAVEALGSIVWPVDAHARPLARAGRLAAMAGAYDLAEGLLVQAVDRQPDLADAWAQLGFARLFAKRFDAAAPALEEAVRLNPSDAVAHGGLAVCELQLGKRDLALRRARAALAIDADEPLARQVVAALGGS